MLPIWFLIGLIAALIALPIMHFDGIRNPWLLCAIAWGFLGAGAIGFVVACALAVSYILRESEKLK